ncbi:MAG: hypothetical protein JNK78_11865 [Planctomycetes bacterium]|nr:hypothetical protein [Planctomycetota bacterium]
MNLRLLAAAGVGLLGLLVFWRCAQVDIPVVLVGQGSGGASNPAAELQAVPAPVRTAVGRPGSTRAGHVGLARVIVSGPLGEPVVGAVVSTLRGDATEPSDEGYTDSEGMLDLGRAPTGPVVVGVEAPDLSPWFGEFRFGPGNETLTVSLRRGLEIAGCVTHAERPVAGVAVRVVGRAGSTWPFPDFVASGTWPSRAAAYTAPEAAAYQWRVTSDATGAFVVRGVEPAWSCLAIVDDERWIGVPVATPASPGDRHLVLRTRPATTVDVVLARDAVGARDPCDVLLTAQSASGDVGSFAFTMREGHGFIRFAVPENWSDPVTYHAVARGEGWALACRERIGHLGERTRLELATDRAGSSEWTLSLNPSWSDGAPCGAGVFVRAFLSTGEMVGARVFPAAPAGYRVTVSAAPARLTWLPWDTFREMDDAVTVDVANAPTGSVINTAMPTGPDLELVLPGAPASVLLEGPTGARSLRVEGVLRLRSVAAGHYTAKATIAGSAMTRAVDVGANGLHRLDFSR